MMRVPRIEIKLRVFSFKLQFTTKVHDYDLWVVMTVYLKCDLQLEYWHHMEILSTGRWAVEESYDIARSFQRGDCLKCTSNFWISAYVLPEVRHSVQPAFKLIYKCLTIVMLIEWVTHDWGLRPHVPLHIIRLQSRRSFGVSCKTLSRSPILHPTKETSMVSATVELPHHDTFLSWFAFHHLYESGMDINWNRCFVLQSQM